MKQDLGMKNKSLAHGIAGILLGSALLVPVASASSDQIVQTAGGVPYVSGVSERIRSNGSIRSPAISISNSCSL